MVKGLGRELLREGVFHTGAQAIQGMRCISVVKDAKVYQ